MDDDSSFEDCTPVASDEDESIDCEDDTYMAVLEQDLMNHLFDAKNESTFILPCCEKKCLENAFMAILSPYNPYNPNHFTYKKRFFLGIP
jgi:hypothetical protein